jgi:hypothetical protein
MLPSKVGERELRNTFLYDDYETSGKDDRAVRMPTAHVDALIAFGRQKGA